MDWWFAIVQDGKRLNGGMGIGTVEWRSGGWVWMLGIASDRTWMNISKSAGRGSGDGLVPEPSEWPVARRGQERISRSGMRRKYISEWRFVVAVVQCLLRFNMKQYVQIYIYMHTHTYRREKFWRDWRPE